MNRAFDIVVSAIGLVMVTPLLILIVVSVRLSMGGPILYRRNRPGLHGQPFTMLKFRTMRETRDSAGHLLPDADRLSALGKFLRATSLDELPELINVLKGEMSLVGPRPLLMEYLDRYSPEQARRHDVKPGITGWAQVNGRNALTWEEKLKLDVWYVDHQSFWFDLKILLRTVVLVLKREGINAQGSATMPEFMGKSYPDR